MNEEFNAGFFPTGEEEDYGLDLNCTGYTDSGRFFHILYEVKTIRRKFTEEYLRTVAGRNAKCRYCDSADTVEELERCSELPEWLTGDTPVHVINSTDKYGRPTGKWHKLREARGGLIYLKEGELLVFTPKGLREAFLGYLWIKCGHTTDFEDNEVTWERKAAIDLAKYSYKIKCEVPRKFLE